MLKPQNHMCIYALMFHQLISQTNTTSSHILTYTIISKYYCFAFLVATYIRTLLLCFALLCILFALPLPFALLFFFTPCMLPKYASNTSVDRFNIMSVFTDDHETNTTLATSKQPTQGKFDSTTLPFCHFFTL